MQLHKPDCVKVLIVVISFWFQNCESANILGLFPHYGYSHFKVFYPIMRGLAQAGHHVVVITHIKDNDPNPNYEEWLLEGHKTTELFQFDHFSADRSYKTLWNEFFALHHEGQRTCHNFYNSSWISKIFERQKQRPFDLVIMEFFNTDCYLGIPHALKVPVVGVSSCALMPWFYDRIALPDFPSYIQTEFMGFPEELDFFDRLQNFIAIKGLKFLYNMVTNRADNAVVEKHLGTKIDTTEFAKKSTSLIFVNQHYTVMGSRPTTPQLIEMGGIHINKDEMNQELPIEIEHFLETVPEGEVLFISWGSMLRASSMDKERVNMILETLKQFPIKVIWKWEDEKVPVVSKQFLFVKWAPQLALLCHPKVKYFWGHGGLLGTTETVVCGKPAIFTPIYGDQFLNAHAVANREAGVIVEYNKLTESNYLKAAITKVLNSPSYTRKAQQLSQLFTDRQHSPLDNAIWWIEHLLKHREMAQRTLRTHAVDMNGLVYHSVDSLFIIGLAAKIILSFVFRTLHLNPII